MLLMMFGSALAIYFIVKSSSLLDEIVVEENEQYYVSSMQKAASIRIIYLYRILNSNDIFVRNDYYTQFMHQGDLFLTASSELKKIFISENELKLWQQLRPKIVKLGQLQNQIIQIALQDDSTINNARELLKLEAIPAQDELLSHLSTLSEYTRKEINEEFSEAIEQGKSTIITIVSFTILIIGLGILISVWVLRHFTNYERVINFEKNKAISANRKKSQFLANMSHEIRTPLTAILGFSQAIKKLHIDKNAFDKITNKIIKNGNHLLDLINDVLDLSKIEAGQLNVENITISPFAIIDEVVAVVSAQAEAKGLTFEINIQYPIPSIIDSDPVRLKQILINLCNNAIKFTEQGTVIIDISFDHLNQKLKFEVIDTGIGMSRSAMNKIFLAFSQANITTTRKFGGTGLGLHISKQLAEKLNGKLSCTSISGVGSKFKLELQLENIGNDLLLNAKSDNISTEQIDTMADNEFVVPNLNGSILLVEDNEDNRDLICMYIDDTNASYTVVENGQFAVQECLQKRKQFDLILMDMEMPMMDGFEATKKLRDNGYTLPIVMLTANALKSDVDSSIEIGANAHLAKPIELDKFYRILAQYVPTERDCSSNSKSSKGELDKNTVTQQFIDSLTLRLEKINQANSDENWQEIIFITNQIKEISKSLNLEEITRSADILYHKALAEEYNDIAWHINRLVSSCNDTQKKNVS